MRRRAPFLPHALQRRRDPLPRAGERGGAVEPRARRGVGRPAGAPPLRQRRVGGGPPPRNGRWRGEGGDDQHRRRARRSRPRRRGAQRVRHGSRGGGRPFDTVARWGGEEFALILSAETTRAEAREICERLRLKIQNMAILVPGLDGRENSVRLTMSLGGAMFPNDVPLNVDRSRGLERPARDKLAHELWTRANMNLRFAKERGK